MLMQLDLLKRLGCITLHVCMRLLHACMHAREAEGYNNRLGEHPFQLGNRLHTSPVLIISPNTMYRLDRLGGSTGPVSSRGPGLHLKTTGNSIRRRKTIALIMQCHAHKPGSVAFVSAFSCFSRSNFSNYACILQLSDPNTSSST